MVDLATSKKRSQIIEKMLISILMSIYEGHCTIIKLD